MKGPIFGWFRRRSKRRDDYPLDRDEWLDTLSLWYEQCCRRLRFWCKKQ